MVKLFIRLLFFIIFSISLSYCDTVRIATYNVNNLLDTKSNKKNQSSNADENSTQTQQSTKIDNIAQVLTDLKADIIALQEVESLNSLKELNSKVNYKYYAISNDGGTKTAILSNYKILRTSNINATQGMKSVLEVHLQVNESVLIAFVVSWHSKNYPETYRRDEAETLKWRLLEIGAKQEYMILGDFNSNYNEYVTFAHNYNLNDTCGETGINHVLNTINGKGLITREVLTSKDNSGYFYNLWLELEKAEDRFSTLQKGKGQTPDNMLLPKTLFDNKGINYIDQTFNVFKPEYLYDKENSKINFSNHLPIYADFNLEPFKLKVDEVDNRILTTIDKLFKVNINDSNFLIKDVVALLQDDRGTILKDPNGRAMYVVGNNDKFKVGNRYEIDITKLDEEYGLRVIKDIGLVVEKGKAENIELYKIYNTNQDFNNIKYQNEVISEIKGMYSKGYFTYSGERQTETIKIVFKNQKLKPEDNTEATFTDVLVSFEQQPVLIVQ